MNLNDMLAVAMEFIIMTTAILVGVVLLIIGAAIGLLLGIGVLLKELLNFI